AARELLHEDEFDRELGHRLPSGREADAPPPMESVDAPTPDRNRNSPFMRARTPKSAQRMARPRHRPAYDRTDACRGREAMQVEAAMSHHEQKGAKSGGTGTAMESGTGSGMA